MSIQKSFGLLVICAAAAATLTAAEWKPLFNGKDLNGWKHVGPGGMTVEDSAKILGVSEPTVKRWWAFSRAWLFNAIRSAR